MRMEGCRRRRFAVALAAAGLLLGALPSGAQPAAAPATGTAAGGGALTLDARVVTSLVERASRRSFTVGMPGWGQVPLEADQARDVRLLDGAVEAVLPVRLAVPGGLAGELDLRLEPAIDRKSGRLLLRVTRAQGRGRLAALPDLAPAFPPVELPRVLERVVALDARHPFRLSVYVQEVDLGPEGLTLRFQVATGPPPAAP